MGLTDLLSPNLCIVCRKPCILLPNFPGFCRKCLQDLPWRFGRMKIDWPCKTTASASVRRTASEGSCPDFRQGGSCLDVYIACDYSYPISHSLLQLKFHGHTGLAEPLAAIGYQAIRRSGIVFDAAAAVPLHKNRLIERGYNQAKLISEKLSERLQCPDLSDFLIRTRSTGRQSEQPNRAGRIANLDNAFKLDLNITSVSRPDRILSGRRILLVDDVMTTGATLRAAALPLAEAGAKVNALVIASDFQSAQHYLSGINLS